MSTCDCVMVVLYIGLPLFGCIISSVAFVWLYYINGCLSLVALHPVLPLFGCIISRVAFVWLYYI